MKLRTEKVVYDMAEPASKIQIIIWLITFGRKGRVFVSKSERYTRVYSQPDGRMINCRCSAPSIVGVPSVRYRL